jgi:hypothetical protein
LSFRCPLANTPQLNTRSRLNHFRMTTDFNETNELIDDFSATAAWTHQWTLFYKSRRTDKRPPQPTIHVLVCPIRWLAMNVYSDFTIPLSVVMSQYTCTLCGQNEMFASGLYTRRRCSGGPYLISLSVLRTGLGWGNGTKLLVKSALVAQNLGYRTSVLFGHVRKTLIINNPFHYFGLVYFDNNPGTYWALPGAWFRNCHKTSLRISRNHRYTKLRGEKFFFVSWQLFRVVSIFPSSFMNRYS